MKKCSKWIYWTPRILSIIFILFLSLFSLDVISEEASFWEIVVGLLMHNIPVFVLLVVLIISWKYEIVGGIAFILAGIAYVILLMKNPFEWYYLVWAMQISGPAFLIGILFLIGWKRRKR